MTQPLLQAADLRGAARLTTDAVAGLTSVVEAMHARIARLPWLPGGVQEPTAEAREERARGLTGVVYKTVRGVAQLVGSGADVVLHRLAPMLPAAESGQAPHPEREALVAALNGVLGDHLAATDNPLAIAMAFRHAGQPLPLDRWSLRMRLPGATPKLLVLIHGLCMNDLQWRRAGRKSEGSDEPGAEHDHGAALAQALGFTPIHLHYNSGLSISTNGRILAALMERLYDAWPLPVERLAIVGHSMGGLVARSAIHHGALLQRGTLRWPARVNDLVCLGTPHQGAPLERAGHGVDRLLGALPYAAPLARLGKVRSAGIHDLRLGNIVAGPVGASLDDSGTPLVAPVALPAATRCFAVAASLGAKPGNLKAELLGDGLVPVASALGRHAEPERHLAFAAEHQAVVRDTGHLELLSSGEVCGLLERWLG
jgi:pimeloyl-ACP methyl ester carboxylesterase